MQSWSRTTLVAALALMALAGADRAAGAETLRIGGTGAAIGLVQELGRGFARRHGGMTIEVPTSLGSSGGIRALLASAVDVAVSSRPLEEAERAAGARETLIGATPLAFVTSRTDWMRGLTSQDLVDYFALRKLNWPDGAPIYIVLRPRSETDFQLLAAAIPGMEAALNRAWEQPDLPIAFTDQDNLDMAEALEGSLAAAALSAVITERRPLTRLSLDGVDPTVENLERGAYPLSRAFYLVTGNPRNPLALAFIEFVRGPDGQRILREGGTLPPARSAR